MIGLLRTINWPDYLFMCLVYPLPCPIVLKIFLVYYNSHWNIIFSKGATRLEEIDIILFLVFKNELLITN